MGVCGVDILCGGVQGGYLMWRCECGGVSVGVCGVDILCGV